MKIAVFGTVGAGKTTLIQNMLSLFPQKKKYEIFWEPIIDNPYIADSYSPDKAKQLASTYQLELFILTNRYKDLKLSSNKENVVYDRGIMDSLIFAECSWINKRITDRDWKVYREYFEECIIPYIFNNDDHGYDLIIYLKVDVETSIQRIAKRGIDREIKADKTFWYTLVELYEKWYQKFKNNAPFLVIDGNANDPLGHAKKVVEYVESISN